MLLCERCQQPQLTYNSWRNRHCSKCQGSAALRWLEDRQADLLPVPYYHIVFTLPAPISAIADYNMELISIVEDEKSVNKRTEKKFAASRRASL